MAFQPLNMQGEIVEGGYLPANTRTPVNEPSSRCLFLSRLVLDIRYQIYGYLLKNPDLGTRKCLKRDEDYEEKLGLSPAILSTCQQISSEATLVLYQQNTFLLMIVYGDQYSAFDRYGKTRYYTSYEKVTRWRLMISPVTEFGFSTHSRMLLVQFCRAICSTKLKSLEILVILDNLLHDPLIEDEQPFEYRKRLAFDVFLNPLQALRNVGTILIRDATFEETAFYEEDSDAPPFFSRPYIWKSVIGNNPKNLEVVDQLKAIVTGNTPVESLHEMHNCLVLYLASFESRQQARETTEREYTSTLYKNYRAGKRSTGSTIFDIFKDSHPIHDAMRRSEWHILENKVALFKRGRRAIIRYLEPQYRRICTAATKMLDFYEKQTSNRGIFAEERIHRNGVWPVEYFDAQVLVEEFLSAVMVRDAPLKYKSTLKRYSRLLEYAPGELEARELLGREPGLPYYGSQSFLDLLRVVVEHLLDRCLEIQKTRAELYKYEIEDKREPDRLKQVANARKRGLYFVLDTLRRPDSPTPSNKTSTSEYNWRGLERLFENAGEGSFGFPIVNN